MIFDCIYNWTVYNKRQHTVPVVDWMFNSLDWFVSLQKWKKYTNAIKSLSLLVQINVKRHIHTAYTHFDRNMQKVTQWFLAEYFRFDWIPRRPANENLCGLLKLQASVLHKLWNFYFTMPYGGSGCAKIDPIRFLSACCKRWLNHALSVQSLCQGFFLIYVCCAVNYRILLSCAIFMLFLCSVAWLFLLVVITSTSDWLAILVSIMTYNVLMGTFNPTHSLTHSTRILQIC